MQRRRIGRQQRTASGSTPHDRVAVPPQICSSCPMPLDWPRPSTTRYPSPLANRPTSYQVRRHPLLIRRPLNRRTQRRIGSIQISQIARGTQIPIASAAPPVVPSSAVSFLGGFRTPAAEHAAPSLMPPASETLHNLRRRAVSRRGPLIPQQRKWVRKRYCRQFKGASVCLSCSFDICINPANG